MFQLLRVCDSPAFHFPTAPVCQCDCSAASSHPSHPSHPSRFRISHVNASYWKAAVGSPSCIIMQKKRMNRDEFPSSFLWHKPKDRLWITIDRGADWQLRALVSTVLSRWLVIHNWPRFIHSGPVSQQTSVHKIASLIIIDPLFNPSAVTQTHCLRTSPRRLFVSGLFFFCSWWHEIVIKILLMNCSLLDWGSEWETFIQSLLNIDSGGEAEWADKGFKREMFVLRFLSPLYCLSDRATRNML